MARRHNALGFFNVLWIFALLLGCSGSNPVTPPPDGGTDGGVDGGTDGGVDGGTDAGTVCVGTVVQAPYIFPDECRTHICFSFTECDDLTQHNPPTYPHNPPIAGPHYWVWGRWGIHMESPPLPRGYWVHNLEHGGVVFVYNPNLASQSVIDALVRVHNAVPLMPGSVFPACCGGIGTGCVNHRRVVLTADPLLDTAWAVTASGSEEQGYCVGFGYYIKGDCIQGAGDEQALVDFAVQHRGMGPEPYCDEGFYPP